MSCLVGMSDDILARVSGGLGMGMASMDSHEICRQRHWDFAPRSFFVPHQWTRREVSCCSMSDIYIWGHKLCSKRNTDNIT